MVTRTIHDSPGQAFPRNCLLTLEEGILYLRFCLFSGWMSGFICSCHVVMETKFLKIHFHFSMSDFDGSKKPKS